MSDDFKHSVVGPTDGAPMKNIVLVVVAGPFLASVACSASVDSMSIDKACVRTACDERQEADSRACSACLSACSSSSHSCDSSRMCSSSCSSSSCSEASQKDCRQTGFKVTLPENSSPELEQACRRAVSRVTSCGGSTIDVLKCSTLAKIERSESAATYDCYANLECGADSSSCTPPPDSFGDDLCGAMESSCPGTCDTISPKLQAALNDEGPWLREDAKSAARGCSTQSTCSDMRACLKAFGDIVF